MKFYLHHVKVTIKNLSRQQVRYGIWFSQICISSWQRKIIVRGDLKEENEERKRKWI